MARSLHRLVSFGLESLNTVGDKMSLRNEPIYREVT